MQANPNLQSSGILGQIRNEFVTSPNALLCYRLTAIFLIMSGFRGEGLGFITVWMRSLSILLLVFPGLLRNSKIWWLMFAGVLVGFFLRYEQLDNHKYLTGYWIFACALSTHAKDPDQSLELNAKILVGLTFTTATCWKIFAGEYFNGSFMIKSLLTDERLGLVTYLSGLTRDQVQANYRLFKELLYFPGEQAYLMLTSIRSIDMMGILVAYWTLLIEGATGITSLLSRFGKIKSFQHFPLMVFIFTTYTIATVPNFGMILCILGFAQCAKDQVKLKYLYLVFFLYMIFLQLMHYIRGYFLFQ